MKNTTITIPYNDEKVAALRLYLGQKNLNVEDELTVAVDSLYTKTVPSNVREFIDLRASTTAPESKRRKHKPSVTDTISDGDAD